MEGIVFIIPVAWLAATWAIGRTIENRHYRSIKARERAWLACPALTSKHLPENRPVARTAFAQGAVVTSADYFKSFISGFRKIVGGELRAYSSVMDRARREAVLRMKESCPGAQVFLNCRLQTTELGRSGNSQIPIVEVFAYATAVYFADEPRG